MVELSFSTKYFNFILTHLLHGAQRHCNSSALNLRVLIFDAIVSFCHFLVVVLLLFSRAVFFTTISRLTHCFYLNIFIALLRNWFDGKRETASIYTKCIKCQRNTSNECMVTTTVRFNECENKRAACGISEMKFSICEILFIVRPNTKQNPMELKQLLRLQFQSKCVIVFIFKALKHLHFYD